MSWEKVSETTSGYVKYRDQYDNLRYKAPDGSFTNENAWAGTQSHGAEEIPEFEVTPGVHYDDIQVDVRGADELEGYQEMRDITIDEPYEDDYFVPQAKSAFAGRGYLLEDYPVDERVDMLSEQLDKYDNYEAYTWGVYTIKVADGAITSSGYRFTTHQDNKRILQEAFRDLIKEIQVAINSSPGDEIIITETVMKCMNF